MHRPFSRIGFTLIELLIVVAIIAILAAIAVPNFLEAQTRSKVSRVLSDMRTLQVGMESYRVDGNSYPGMYESLNRQVNPSAANVLSTPIAYLSRSLIRDPFAEPNLGNRYITFAVGIKSQLRGSDPQYWPKDCYAIASWGPDKKDNTDCNDYPYGIASAVTATADGWAGPYDPTNGTVSKGEIAIGMPRLPKTWVINTGADLAPPTDPFAY